MQTNALPLWRLRLATFSVAALAAASAAYWVLKWTGTAPMHPGAALVVPAPSPLDTQAVARLLGGGQTSAMPAPGAAPAQAASRFKLTGVVAGPANSGYALIAIDGKPAQPYRVGARVDDALVLQSVTQRSAALAASTNAPVAMTLDLPKLAAP
jgi:general secretion pathway protein C